MEVPKKLLNIPKNGFLYKWSTMMKDVIEKVSSFEPSDCDYWDKALKAIECMKLYTDSTTISNFADKKTWTKV